VKLRRITRAVWGVAAVLVAFSVWMFTGDSKPKDNAPGFKSGVVKADGKTDFEAIKRMTDRQGAQVSPESEKPAEGAAGGPAALAEAADPEPYGGKTLHLTGMMRLKGRTLYTFAVSVSGSVMAQVTSDDLVTAGYRWQALTDCAGYLRWGKSAKAITCDAPTRTAGSPDKPIVMNSGYGSDGRTPATSTSPQPAAPPLTTM
jgi:zona occludens toxin